jgi:hypothetical protein
MHVSIPDDTHTPFSPVFFAPKQTPTRLPEGSLNLSYRKVRPVKTGHVRISKEKRT